METKYHIQYPDDGNHIIESQQLDLMRFFEENSLWDMKKDLNKMTEEILSYETTRNDYSKLIERLKFLVDFGWELIFQEHKHQIRFEQNSIEYIKNPFYLKKSAQSAEFRQRNSGLSGLYGDITNLTLEEAADIYRTLNSFYNEISVLSWLKLLDDWLWISTESGGLWNFTSRDENPIKTQKFLLKLIESLYLFSISDWLTQAIESPTIHLFSGPTAFKEMDISSLDQYNPYFWLEMTFFNKTVDHYLASLNYLYNETKEDTSETLSNKEIFKLGKELRILIETTWVNIQCKALPRDFTALIDDESIGEEEINRQITEILRVISPDRPIEIQELIVELFDKEWKVRTYRQLIDDLVQHRICDRINKFWGYCEIADIELLIRVCYLMHLEIRKQKIEGELGWPQL
jgi:hypothetical protein